MPQVWQVSACVAVCVATALLLAGRPLPARRYRSPRIGLGGRGGRHSARTTAPTLRERLRRWRGRRRSQEDLGLQIGAMVGEAAALLRAGALPEDAWREAGTRRPALLSALTEGSDPAVRRAHQGVQAAMRLAQDVGAPPADVLDHCRRALADAADAETARRIALAGPQSSARLLAALPLLGLVLGAGLGADPVAVFTDGSWGTVCLLVGVALMVLGHRWVRREVARARDEEGP